MELRLTSTAAPIIGTADAKAHLRVLHDDDDAYIDSLVLVAQDWMFGENSWLGRSAPESEWEGRLASFPIGKLVLPRPPFISVESIRYTPGDGSAEVDLIGFRSFGSGGEGYVLPAKGADWPVTDGEPESVKITFKAGYADLPKSIRHAALLLIGHWYENREAVTEVKMSELPAAVDALLMPYRNWNA